MANWSEDQYTARNVLLLYCITFTNIIYPLVTFPHIGIAVILVVVVKMWQGSETNEWYFYFALFHFILLFSELLILKECQVYIFPFKDKAN